MKGGKAVRAGFVWLDEAVPGLLWDAKYATADNFTGAAVDGYPRNRLAGTAELAAGLARAAKLAAGEGLRLFLWDAYRPQRAVDRFLAWCAAPEDGRTKQKHYPNIAKGDIVPLGYVAARSGHSRGSAVDLTLARPGGGLLDMGGGFDLMDAVSHHGAPVGARAAQNRLLLRAIMEKSGFAPYENEWWHYALRDEPYPHAYFDFLPE